MAVAFDKFVEFTHKQLLLYVIVFNTIEQVAIFVSIKELDGSSMYMKPLAGTEFLILKFIV